MAAPCVAHHEVPAVIVFLDTEFTSLVDDPRLLSLAMVVGPEARREFYAEVTDAERLAGSSAFVRQTVLPQFGRVPGASCRYAELGARAARFLQELRGELCAGEIIDIAFESWVDWDLLADAVRYGAPREWSHTRDLLRPYNVADIEGCVAGRVAAAAYFISQEHAAVSRHHALCDARALGVAYAAIVRRPRTSTGDQSSHAA